MKKNSKGFTLFETLVISTFVVGTLIYLFSQFVILKDNYNSSFKYNTVEGLYKALNVDRYLTGIEAVNVIHEVRKSSFNYTDISSCTTLSSSSYCSTLFNSLNIKLALVAKGNLQGLLNVLENNNPYDEGLYKFIKKQKVGTNSKYHLILEYNDGTYARIVLNIG